MERLTVQSILGDRVSDRVYLETTTGGRWTYAETAKAVAMRRERLMAWGIRPSHRLALKIEDPGEFVLWFLAALAHESIVVPVNPAAPDDDVRRTLEKSGAAYIFDGVHAPTLTGIPAIVSSSRRGGGIILLTSGSTGDPKPVGLSFEALWHTATEVSRAHRYTAEDRGFSPLPLFHINALVVAVLGSLVAGSAIVIADGFHARDFWDTIKRFDISWINLVPSILMVLSQRPEQPLVGSRPIRFIRSASAPLPLATRQLVERRFGIGVVETYGMTEAGSQICSNPLPGEGGKPGSVGVPRGTEVRIVDERGIPLPAQVRGSVEIRGPGVIDAHFGPNYWAKAILNQGFYPTGDLGYLDKDGFLYLDGRSRDIINRGGEKIFPREVEEWLLSCEGVADCAVVGRPHPVLGEEPVAFIVARDENVLMIEGIESWAEQGLARFKRPAAYFVVRSLPKGSTGKIARQDLRQQVREGGS